MREQGDFELIREYVRAGSEAAFTELVSRHINFVYSAALRQVRHPHLAQEVAQAVFLLLARKASKIRETTLLAAWLFRTTRFVALTQIRSASRRLRYEKEAQMPAGDEPSHPGELWAQVSPRLDGALSKLGETDRRAILLRFFESKNLAEVGSLLGLKEDTARKRIDRALLKLQRHFRAQGITSTNTILGDLISVHGVEDAPAGLTQVTVAVTLAKCVAPSGSTATLVKGALQMMSWTQAKTAVTLGIGILLVGAATLSVHYAHPKRVLSWQAEPFNFKLIDQQPPQVLILPSRAKSDNWDREQGGAGRMMGLGMTADQLVLRAYGARPVRMVLTFEVPMETYDFIASLPSGNPEGLQQELKRKLGIVGHREWVTTNAFVLTVSTAHALGLRRSLDTNRPASFQREPGTMVIRNGSLSKVLALLEGQFQRPILDQTGLDGHLDLDFHWNDADATFHDPVVLAQTARQIEEQLGLTLKPAVALVEMLIVEKND
jgi:uncharacterized protein (TIGR03435 family)